MTTEKSGGKGIFTSIIRGAVAGLLFGGVVGLIEALVILKLNGWAGDTGVLPYGTVVYALAGIIPGAVVGLIVGVMTLGKASAAFSAAFAGAGTWLILGFVATRHHYLADIRNGAPLTTGNNVMVAGGVLIAAALAFVIAWFLFSKTFIRSATRIGGGIGWFVVIFIASFVAGLIPAVLHEGSELQMTEWDPVKLENLENSPNIVLIVVDSLRADHMGIYGYEKPVTPRMDELAADSLLFERAYAQSADSKPSVATLVTSLRPSAHGVVGPLDSLPVTAKTLASELSDQGYYTAGISACPQTSAEYGFQSGFNEYSDITLQYPLLGSGTISQLALYVQMRKRLSRNEADLTVDQFYKTAKEVTEEAIKIVYREESRRTFFLFVHYMDPHPPYFSQDGSTGAFTRADNPSPDSGNVQRAVNLYDGEIAAVDEQIGILLDRLRGYQLYDNTLVILTSSHGTEFADHGGFWHGETLYDEQVHVPLIMKMTNSYKGGTRLPFQVRTIDIAPTILQMAAANQPESMEGSSVIQWGLEEEIGVPFIFAEQDVVGGALRSVRSNTHKLIRATEGNPRGLPEMELFDLTADGEARAVNDEQPDTLQELDARLREFVESGLRKSADGAQSEIDDAAKEKLEALGYL